MLEKLEDSEEFDREHRTVCCSGHLLLQTMGQIFNLFYSVSANKTSTYCSSEE